jgi:hypothetical protein
VINKTYDYYSDVLYSELVIPTDLSKQGLLCWLSTGINPPLLSQTYSHKLLRSTGAQLTFSCHPVPIPIRVVRKDSWVSGGFQLALPKGRTPPRSKADFLFPHFVLEKAMRCKNLNALMYTLITKFIIQT